jgi:GNAT superfamily N-acetyltransferase
MPGRRAAAAFSLTEVAAPGADADAVRDLFLEYGESLGFNTCFGAFDEDLASLPGSYGPPHGCLLLARSDGAVAGCAGVRRLDAASCEMKRLYVRPLFRRSGLGRQLAQAAIARARTVGYRRVRLDTLPAMIEARALYAGLGFRPCAPPDDNRLAGSQCFELELAPAVRG